MKREKKRKCACVCVWGGGGVSDSNEGLEEIENEAGRDG